MHKQRTTILFTLLVIGLCSSVHAQMPTDRPHWVWTKAYAVPKETTNQGSGYFSIVEGRDGRIYVGTAKYGENSFLVEFDPQTEQMNTVVDVHKTIGTTARGFAAQSKIHTRNNVGESGKIYFATKQGYPEEGESVKDYLGGYPMVYDPATGTTRAYEIPIPHQGIISITPDESRKIAYISTCADERPIDSSHFMILDLETGKYRDLMDCRHMYAFIVIDHLGRAYHPVLGGTIARYDPQTDKLEQLQQTIDGQPPTAGSLLAHPESHVVNWEVSPDRKTLYCVAMSGNQLFSYDLTSSGTTLVGRSHGKLIPTATATDCRAMCVGADGTVWAGVVASFEGRQEDRLVSYTPGAPAPVDHGPFAISNPDYTTFTDENGQPLPWHQGVEKLPDGTLVSRYSIMGICAGQDGTVYLTTLAPLTVHAIRIPKVAGVCSVYHHNSHADVILSRFLETDTLDGKGQNTSVKLVSLFTDQVPAHDISRRLAAEHSIPIFNTVKETLSLGKEKMAVDGVLLVAEHGQYPQSDTGQVVYPKRRLMAEVFDEIRASGRPVPVFCDKHLADNWQDAKWIYDTARELKVPMMAGSSLPGLWRYPPTDVRRGAKLKEIVAVSYHTLDAYGFHALEMVQTLAERRAGGETGISAVQCITGPGVWETGRFDRTLLDKALAQLKRPIPADKRVEDLAVEPVLFSIEYSDGLKASVLTLNYAVGEWSSAWRYDDDSTDATLFWTQEARPFHHFNYLVQGIEKMMHTGKPAWPVERTLMSSGVLDALLISKRDGGVRLETPHLQIVYQSDWDWQQPPPPPADRPIDQQ